MEEKAKKGFLNNLFSKRFIENINRDEIKTIIEISESKNIISDQESDMILNILKSDDKDAKDIMTHRKDIIAIDSELTLAEAVNFMLDQPYTRIPVFSEDIDNIIGVINLRNVFKLYISPNTHSMKLSEINGLLRPINLVPETRDLDQLFQEMQENKTHLIVVVDEYGRTSGIVSIEDIIKEIIGNVFDEDDKEGDDIITISENKYIVKGITSLEELSEILNIDFEDEENETINGFLITLLGHLPDGEEKIELDFKGYKFKAIMVDDKFIEKIIITKEQSEE